jgi:hypothetical protein
MKLRVLFFSIACPLACGHVAAAQAISQGALLNQQSVQSAGNAKSQPVKVIQPGSPRAVASATPETVADASIPPSSFVDSGRSRQPYLSEYAGYVAPGTELVISNPNPAATIYYTIDGWTPTQDSYRYEVPIVIRNDVRVQAFAVEPGLSPSPIVDATYIVKPQQPLIKKSLLIDDGILHRGMVLRLVTGINARSDSAQVGDTMLLKLDENILVGDSIVAAKGSLGKGTITRVERAARGGKPGVLGFKVDSLDVHGVSIPLSANLTLAAPDLEAKAVKLSDPSVVHVSGALPKGDEAAIEPGMPLTAIVGADVPLK